VEKSTNPYRANFRCPLCGDSKKSKSKKRGWLLGDTKGTTFYCHNCGRKMPFSVFLKRVSPNLYSDYVYGRFKKSSDRSARNVLDDFDAGEDEVGTTRSNTHLKPLKRVDTLRHGHKAQKFVEGRKIPPKHQKLLYHCPRFNLWTNTMIPDKLNADKDEARLVIPFFDENGMMFGYAGRSYQKDAKLRYITIMLDNSATKIYGMERLDSCRTYFVVEGQLDSLFLENAIAMGGSDVDLSVLPNHENATIVYDNEPRNKEIVSKIGRAIKAGYKVCVWPKHIMQKDINDMVLAGIDAQDVIEKSTYQGLKADLEFGKWRKIHGC